MDEEFLPKPSFSDIRKEMAKKNIHIPSLSDIRKEMDEEYIPMPSFSDLQKVLEYIFEKRLIDALVRCIIGDENLIIKFYNSSYYSFDPEATFYFTINKFKEWNEGRYREYTTLTKRKDKVEDVLKYCKKHNLIHSVHFEVNYYDVIPDGTLKTFP